jgi:hypothetical protein
MSNVNDPTPIATSQQYRAALLAVRERMTEVQFKMLQAHCRSEGHSTTTNRLAKAVGISTASRYSNYAQWIADELKFVPKPGEKKQMWLHALAYGRHDASSTVDGHYEWIMRPELVETLQVMKWA